jgi:hypothetical protein
MFPLVVHHTAALANNIHSADWISYGFHVPVENFACNLNSGGLNLLWKMLRVCVYPQYSSMYVMLGSQTLLTEQKSLPQL